MDVGQLPLLKVDPAALSRVSGTLLELIVLTGFFAIPRARYGGIISDLIKSPPAMPSAESKYFEKMQRWQTRDT